MKQDHPASTGSPLQGTVDRCLELGLCAWIFDASLQPAAPPTGPAALNSLLQSPQLNQRINQAAQSAGDSPEPLTHDLAPGWRLLSLPDRRGSRLQGILLAMLIEPAAVASAEFAELCTASGLDLPGTRALVLAHLDEVGLNNAAAARVLRWSMQDLPQIHKQKQTLTEFRENLTQSYEEANLLFRLARFMNCVNEPAQVMQMICQQIRDTLPFGWVAIRFSSDDRQLPTLAGSLLLAGEPPCDLPALDAAAGDLLKNCSADNWIRMLEPERHQLARLVNAQVLVDPISHDGRVIGALLAGNKASPDADTTSVETQFLDAAADFMGVFHENMARFTEQRALFMGTLGALTASIDAKDRYTCGHSERVGLLASQLATALRLPPAEVEQYRIAGMVHDVGKIGVPEAVLCKTGRLSDEEFAAIQQHPRIGHDILKDIPPLAAVLPGVLHHHERWDGQGYPDRLAGPAIPRIARILALADTFDAMSSNRSYRPAMPRQQVLAEFRKCAGTQFDPDLVPLLVNLDFTEFDKLVDRHQNMHGFAA